MNLADISIKRPIFILCMVVLMLVSGYMSMRTMPVDQFPDVTFPIVSIAVTYPGASPVDLEREVSKKIEDEISSLPGMDTLSSNNYEGMAVVLAKFKIGTDIKDLEQQIRNRVGNIRSKLPDDINEPVIRRFDPADQAIMFLSVTSKLPPGELFDVVDERVKPSFERLQDVGQVQIYGGRKREVRVYVDKKKLQDRELSMLQVSQRIEQTSKDVPVGKFENRAAETTLRSSGEFTSFEDIKNVAVNFLGSDRPVKLKEIADVTMTLEDATNLASVNGQSTLTMAIFKQSGTNTVAVADRVKNAIGSVNDTLKARGIDAEVRLVRDGAVAIRMNVADVYETIIIGIFLCVLVVFFFLGSARSTLITGMALPNSLLGGFIIMSLAGFSINVLTLLALSLAVGLLIDDAIVVRENIFRHLEMGKKPVQAALDGTKEVGMAVFATTMVVIAVFGPIAFVPGIIGQFFKQFGLTVVFTMLISLLDAFTVAPMMSAHLATASEHEKGDGVVGRMLKAFDRFQTWLEDLYEASLRWTLGHRKTVLAVAGLIFFASLGLTKFIPKTFLPPNEIGEFMVQVELPVGTSLEGTDEYTKKIEAELREQPEVDLILKQVGTQQLESNKASFYVTLVPRKERKDSVTAIKARVRELMTKHKSEAIIGVSDFDISGGGQKPFNLFLTGDDLDSLAKYAERLQANIIKNVKDLADVDTNFRSGKPEFRVVFDRVRSENLGVSTATAGMELRNRTEGTESGIYRQNGIEYKIRTRLQEDQRDLRSNFATTVVPNSNNNMIPLPRIAQGVDAKGFSQINRQNKGRYIAIVANLSQGGNLGNATTAVENLLKADPPPPGISYTFEGQAKDFAELMVNMVIAMGFGVLLIYLVLASLYESFITPLTILLALPLAITGAFAGLAVTGKTIDIFSLIGLVMLLGVVAKNSILLVDYTRHKLAEGLSEYDALIVACRTRLRPILMTSFALIAGILPIAIGISEIGSQRQSMGVAIISGVISSTFLTLLVVPAAYGYIERFNRWVTGLFRRYVQGRMGNEESAPAAHHG